MPPVKTKAKAPAKKKPGKSVEKKKRTISPEERKRRSEAMKQRISEGKAGPNFGKLGGRPRKKRASEVVAEIASDKGKEIAQVFLDGIDEHMPQSLRQKAAEGLMKVEEKEARLQMDEEEHIARMGREDLLDGLVEMFACNPMLHEMFRSAANNVPDEIEDVIEAEVVGD